MAELADVFGNPPTATPAPSSLTPIGPIAGAAPGSVSSYLYNAVTATGIPYLFAGQPPATPTTGSMATVTTQPATPSGTVTTAPDLTAATGTSADVLGNLLNAIQPSQNPPGLAGSPTTSYGYDSGLQQQQPSAGGGPNYLLWGLLIAAVLVGYWYWKKYHKKKAGEGGSEHRAE